MSSRQFHVADREISDDLTNLTANRIAIRRASFEGKEGLGAFLDRREPFWRL